MARRVIVVDASALIDVLVGEGHATERLAAEELIAPHLLDAEVGSVLRRMTLAGHLNPEDAEQALEDVGQLQIRRHEHAPLLLRAFALRENLTLYDALYVVLAEAFDVPVVTLDARLARAPGVRATIEVVLLGLGG
jgi:predicted nucleic acid-binding protein